LRSVIPNCSGFFSRRRNPGAAMTRGTMNESISWWHRGEDRAHPRDYREAGSVNGLLALWGFVDDTTFLTKAGHVGVVYRLQGIDYEGLTHGQRGVLVHRFEAALRLLDERCRLYQYLIKRQADPFTAAECLQPVANEAIQRRCGYLNDRRSELYIC